MAIFLAASLTGPAQAVLVDLAEDARRLLRTQGSPFAQIRHCGKNGALQVTIKESGQGGKKGLCQNLHEQYIDS